MSDSPIPSLRLIDREHVRAELFRASDQPSAQVCVTFTERGHRDLAGVGFGGALLLRNGIDVLAVKADVDHWYQPLRPGDLSTMRQVIERYPARVGYGSSMGGYAAIRFSAALKLHRVLALSPVLDIMPDWEIRYLADRSQVRTAMLPPDAVRRSCRFFVAVDPGDRLDAAQLRLLADHLPAEQVTLLPVPRGGHPVGPALLELGTLQPLVLDVVRRGRIPPNVRFRRAARSAASLHALAARCGVSGRRALALAVNERAIRLDADWGESYIQRCRLLWDEGRRQDAITTGRLATLLLPDNPHVAGYLSLLMKEDERPDEAAAILALARQRLGDDPVLLEVERQLG